MLSYNYGVRQPDDNFGMWDYQIRVLAQIIGKRL